MVGQTVEWTKIVSVNTCVITVPFYPAENTACVLILVTFRALLLLTCDTQQAYVRCFDIFPGDTNLYLKVSWSGYISIITADLLALALNWRKAVQGASPASLPMPLANVLVRDGGCDKLLIGRTISLCKIMSISRICSVPVSLILGYTVWISVILTRKPEEDS